MATRPGYFGAFVGDYEGDYLGGGEAAPEPEPGPPTIVTPPNYYFRPRAPRAFYVMRRKRY